MRTMTLRGTALKVFQYGMQIMELLCSLCAINAITWFTTLTHKMMDSPKCAQRGQGGGRGGGGTQSLCSVAQCA